MKQLYFSLLFLITLTSAFAQQDFRKGYIIQSGDTLKGYVDYRGDKKSSQTTAFKQTLGSIEQIYTPDMISGYGFEEELKMYESHTIPAAQPDIQPQTVFLNALVKGKASIYTYRDAEWLEHYYLLMEGGSLVELVEQKYQHTNSKTGKRYNVTDKKFTGILASVFSSCPDLKESHFQKLSLNPPSLIDIAMKYNRCVDPESIVYEQENRKSKLTAGPVIYYYTSSINFTGDTYLSQVKFSDESANVGTGISLNATLPKLNEKLSVQFDLLYVPTKFNGNITEEGSYGSTKTYEASFDLAYLKLPIQFRYTYPRGHFRPYANAGIMVGYAVKDKNQVKKTTRGTVDSHTNTYPAIPGNNDVNGFRNLTQGLTAGAGLTYPYFRGIINMEARYEINNGMSSIKSIGSTVSTLYIMLGYSF